jgi:hypothetical protein
MLGVIDGDGGLFKPGGNLTRAAFCKMCAIIMGRGGEEPLYRNRTIFPDVRSNHWARGYIGLAVSGERKIISGFTDGTFRPDESITYAQAVTLLARVLGYTDADAGLLWPSGYLDIAARIGLTDGVELGSGDAITRAQAARLFCNMLSASTKDGAVFLSSLGDAVEDVIIMDLDAETADGKPGAVKTSLGVLQPLGDIVPETFLGKRGTLITDAGGRMVTFLPKGGESLSVIVDAAGASWLRDSSGRRHEIPGKTPVYTSGETTTLAEIFVDIAPGAAITIFYSPGGAPEALYMNTKISEEALVVTSASVSYATFSPITDGSAQFTIYKNGSEAGLGDISEYDVATYDSASRVLRVSDFRITGYYENAWPNTDTPSRVTVMGKEFDVLPGAAQTMREFGLGQVFTLLFTADRAVAGAVDQTQARGTAIGIVGDDASGASATVTLLDGTQFTGNPGLSDYSAAQMRGELVNVLSSGVGKITLVRIMSRQGVKGDLDISARTLGDLDLSRGARVFERVGKGAVAQISFDDIAGPDDKIPGSRVAYAGTDSHNRVDLLILDDVTGDRYTYGFLTEKYLSAPSLGEDDGAVNRYAYVTNSQGVSPEALAPGLEFRSGQLAGLALSGNGERAVAIAPLTAYENVRRSDFTVSGDKARVKLGDGSEVPVADGAQFYNKISKTWFASLADARAFSETLTVYCDKTPQTGGKARIIIAG